MNKELIVKLTKELVEDTNTAEYRLSEMREYIPCAEWMTEKSIASAFAELAYLRVLHNERNK